MSALHIYGTEIMLLFRLVIFIIVDYGYNVKFRGKSERKFDIYDIALPFTPIFAIHDTQIETVKRL